ncbi:VOC family protein [Nocardioides sp. HDW12B]|uniref:VOC family protein n=1 Tax=Nocardioides sp. HDW12B TaxID=2714939 RepID=UPI001F0DEC9E|nr:VOC family protein [Nocardioides sp. HDW12B]
MIPSLPSLTTRPDAAWKDLCLDAVDPVRLGSFWGALLGLAAEVLDNGDVVLRGATPQDTVWVNAVPEPQAVKHRVHLDVRAPVADVVALGGTVVDDATYSWVVVRDPEGGELCVFPPRADRPVGPMELVVDCADPQAQAVWWAGVLGVDAQHDADNGWSFLEGVPGCPFEYLVFVPVPEPKVVKNRVHWDLVVPDLSALLVKGAALLLPEGDEAEGGLAWSVLADPEGNEFCAFVGALD